MAGMGQHKRTIRKNAAAVELGKRGGTATKVKYNHEYWALLARKRRLPDDKVSNHALYMREYRIGFRKRKLAMCLKHTEMQWRAQVAARSANPTLDGSIECVDCGAPATCYDHRDYSKPLDVEPVCWKCNAQRGPAKFSPAGLRQYVHPLDRTPEHIEMLNKPIDQFRPPAKPKPIDPPTFKQRYEKADWEW